MFVVFLNEKAFNDVQNAFMAKTRGRLYKVIEKEASPNPNRQLANTSRFMGKPGSNPFGQSINNCNITLN